MFNSSKMGFYEELTALFNYLKAFLILCTPALY